MMRPLTVVPGRRVNAERAMWLFGAVCLTLPLWSFWAPPDVPAWLKWFVAALCAVSAFRPHAGLTILAGIGPMAVPLMLVSGSPPFGGNAVLEAMVLSVLAGIAWRWGVTDPLTRGRLTLPSLAFGAVAIASVVTRAGLQQLVAGPLAAVAGPWWTHVTRDYFSQPRDFTAWHGAAVWVEALLLALMIERVIRRAPAFGPVLALITACGLAAESAFSLLRLGQVVARSPDVASAFWRHGFSTRISPHFPDVNAIGSLFALGTVCWLTMAMGQQLSRWHRAGAVGGTLIIGAALWLTGSRAAMGATVLTGLVMWWRVRQPSLKLIAATLAVVGTIGLLLATSVVRIPRASVATALNIRIELAWVGLRMAADHPWLGVGLGEFSRRSKEYISPQLVAQFPAAASGENAHNQLIQILGELGCIGLAAFVWYWSRLLVPAVRLVRSGESGRWLTAWTAGLCAFHLSALLGHPFLTPYVVFCVFGSVGVVAGLIPETL